MSDLKALFDQAKKNVEKLTHRPSNDQLLALYSLFKQATDGDVHGKRPGMLDMVGRAKYDAWTQREGTPKEQAMQDYVALVQQLIDADGD
ncbi:MAG: acyl-CoA-binding protein [Panacagrimonas sp.]